MKDFEFATSEQQLLQIASESVAKAQKLGAEEAFARVSENIALGVDVRAARPEAIQFSQHIDFSIKVLVNNQPGTASCNSLAPDDLALATERSLAIARQMQPDEFEGLAEAGLLCADADLRTLELYHPWRPELGELVRLSKEMNEASWEVDERINREKSEGAGATTYEARFAMASSNGLAQAATGSRHAFSCSVIADLEDGMETAYWGDIKRASDDLDDHVEIATKAAKRAVARAGCRPLAGGKFPVIFETGASHSLVRAFLQGISGEKLWRKLSCFADHAGKKVWSDHVTLHERPLLPRGLGSSPYDSEGVRTSDKDIVANGVLSSYLLDSYSARKLALAPTGNAGGTHNLGVDCDTVTLEKLLERLDTGLLVTGLMGGGANLTTGDYSAGASGFWVEGGKIAHPVRDATIASNFPQMLSSVVAGADDYRILGDTRCGSLLIEEMMVAGSA